MSINSKLSAIAALAILAVAWLKFTGGCSGGNVPVAESAPFSTAIADYLRAKSFGMEAVEFKSIKVDGDKAETVCLMQDAQSIYNLKVKWTFSLHKDGKGWKVTAHRQD